MQQEQRRSPVSWVGIRDHGDDRRRNGVEDGMQRSVRVDVEDGQRVGAWPDRKHRIARHLALVGVMVRRLVRVFMRMREQQPQRQLTGVTEEGEAHQDEDE